MNILHGNILFSKSYDELVTYEDSYLIVENGKVRDRTRGLIAERNSQ